jgi:hypothetical protein
VAHGDPNHGGGRYLDQQVTLLNVTFVKTSPESSEKQQESCGSGPRDFALQKILDPKGIIVSKDLAVVTRAS